MPKMKVWNGTAWIVLDANDADTVDGKHASDFAQAAFKTIAVSGQSNVDADAVADTLTLANGNNISITTNAATDTITIGVTGIASGAEVNQNAFSNIAVAGQTTVAAETKTDTVTFIAGTNMTITTDAANDTVTFNAASTGQMNQNAFSNIAVAGQTTVTAETTTDTVTLIAGNNVTITTDAVNDTVTINASQPTIPNMFTNYVANGVTIQPETTTDTLTFTPEKGIAITGNATSDTVTFGTNLVTTSETQPGSPYEGMIWYKNSTSETKIYMNGGFRAVSGNLVERTGTVTLGASGSTATVPVAVNTGDIVMVFQGGTMLQKATDYTISGTTVTKVGTAWQSGTVLDFVVIGGSAPSATTYDGSLINNGTVTDAKMHTDAKVGSLATLKTQVKTSAVAGINYVFDIANANQNVIGDTGILHSGEICQDIEDIRTGKMFIRDEVTGVYYGLTIRNGELFLKEV